MIKHLHKYLHIELFLLALGLTYFSCHSGNTPSLTDDDANESTIEVKDETSTSNPGIKLEDLTLEEKVGQIFIVHPEELCKSNPTTQVDQEMIANLQKYPVGGVLLFGANIKDPAQVKEFSRQFKEACKYPPFFAVDEEGGTVARIGRNRNFDVERITNMIDIGKTGETSNAFDVGSVIGKYLNENGFNLDLAPIADIYSNPANTVIGKRAFGTTPEAVSPMVGACCKGLQSQGVFSVLKHFPGHGDTDTDSHAELPRVSKTWDELLKCEIIPFRDNFNVADMIMIAHIAVTDVNEEINGKTAPSTLSYNMLTKKLRKELGYEGIIITDAMKMAAIANYYPTQGEAAIQAIKAGADIVLCPAKFLGPEGTFNAVVNAVLNGEIPQERIDESVQRILDIKNQWPNE